MRKRHKQSQLSFCPHVWQLCLYLLSNCKWLTVTHRRTYPYALFVENMGNSQNAQQRSEVQPVRHTTPKVKPPLPFESQNEFFKTWYIWKAAFLRYRNAAYKNINDKSKLGNTMLNLMGPVGLDIHSTFTATYKDEVDNMDVLLEKFDEFFLFGTRRREVREDIYKYINELQTIAKARGIDNYEIVIKRKIVKEIDLNHFTTAAKTLMPIFTFSNDFEKLTLKETAFIWMLYSDDMMKNCKNCGYDHDAKSKCPALEKQCTKCKEWNHFSKRCPSVFINNCSFCGGSHFHKKCPAYGETCTRCLRVNHFFWRCQQQQILQCKFCNLSHAASKSVCPARNLICSKCYETGHIASRCNKGSRPSRH